MIQEKELEDFLIESNGSRFNPGIAAALSIRFKLDWNRIQLGWIEKEAKNRGPSQ